MKARRKRTTSALWLLAAALVVAQPLAALDASAHRHDETCCCPAEPGPGSSCCSAGEAELPRAPLAEAPSCDCRATPATPTPQRPIAPAQPDGTSTELGARLARGAWISGHTLAVDHATRPAAEARAGPMPSALDPVLCDRIRPALRRLLARGVPGHLAELSVARL